jgi:hypothetical protein
MTIQGQLTSSQLSSNTKHDFTGYVGYTCAPSDGSALNMDDLARDDPLFREVRSVHVEDVRGSEDTFNLEEHGFQYFKLPHIPGDGEIDFYNEEDPSILMIHYPGMAEWFAKQYSNLTTFKPQKLTSYQNRRKEGRHIRSYRTQRTILCQG